MGFNFSSDLKFSFLIKSLLFFSILIFYLVFVSNTSSLSFFAPFKKTVVPQLKEEASDDSPTNPGHLVFGLLGSEHAWHHRKAYTESWWRPNVCRGFLYLDVAPTGELLPWSKASPPYRVSDNLTEFLEETKAVAPVMIRMVHGIMEVFREVEHENFRWLVMGDDDSVFFIDNMVDVLAQYDHTKYYYLGGQSEFIYSNYWYSFNQGFGGAGFILSYPLAKALAQDMENCLRRHAKVKSADQITMLCIADIGVNLSPQKGIHQIDLRGDISGFLSSHPKSPLFSLHHLDNVAPLFPAMDKCQSTRHLMSVAKLDQSRMLQQTMCHHRQHNWTFSISFGYSAQIYEKILPRSFLQDPIETFRTWSHVNREPPYYMFNTRLPNSNDPGENPHVFFLKKAEKVSKEIVTMYSRASLRNSTADFISEIQVFSSETKRKEMDRCECCDIVGIYGDRAKLRFRECRKNEIIA